MRAGDEDRARGTDEIFRNIVLAKRVVGAVVAIEKEREGFVVLDGEDRKCGQPLRVGDDAARLHAFALKLLADEAAHLFVADARQERRFQAEARCAHGNVAGAAADGFGEARHVFEPRADLLSVEVD